MRLVPAIVPIVSVLVAAVLSGCSGAGVDAPSAIELDDGPLPVTVDLLASSYDSASITADAAYTERTVQLRGVNVDEIQAWFYSGAGYSAVAPTFIKGPQDYFIISGGIKFKPRDPAYLVSLIPGSIVDIVGRCRGVTGGEIVVDDCWIKLTGGGFSSGASY